MTSGDSLSYVARDGRRIEEGIYGITEVRPKVLRWVKVI